MIHENDVRYCTAVASIKLVAAGVVLDLTEDDYRFLINGKLWISTDRQRARRCIEAAVYGALDYLGYPRFPAPAEFIAAVIAFYVSPSNIQTACAIMDGCEFSEYIASGIERPVKAMELFAFVLRIRSGLLRQVDGAEDAALERLTTGQVGVK